MKRLRCYIGLHHYAWVWSSAMKVSGGTMCIFCGKSPGINHYTPVIFVQDRQARNKS